MSIAIVSGVLANKPHNGGEAWVRLSWVRGLQRLGFDVHFWESLDSASCTDATSRPCPPAQSIQRLWFDRVSNDFSLAGRAALIVDGGGEVFGSSRDDLSHFADSASLLINISGNLKDSTLVSRVRQKVFLDIDPGFTQIWQAQGLPGAEICGHDFYFTIGENIGTPACNLPTNGIRWRHTRQPVVLEDWPVSPPEQHANFTTIANWRGPYGTIGWNNQTLGLKVHEFRKFMTLPRQLPTCSFEIALNIHPADHRDREQLLSHGWQLSEPAKIAGSPQQFREFIRRSAGEFSVAQGVYVQTACGWFSDRSTRYLASGRPVIVQDTGLGERLPTGQGLLTFSTVEQAVEQINRLVADYEMHCEQAHRVARKYFACEVVLGRLLDQIGVHP